MRLLRLRGTRERLSDRRGEAPIVGKCLECVMDLFVPALAPNPCADKAHCAGKAGRLAKRGNAGSARIRSQPGGKPPLGAHDCVGSALKPLRILRPCRLVLHAQRGFRGDERAHDTLSHFPTTGLRPPVRKCSRLPRNRRRRLPLRTALHGFTHCGSEQKDNRQSKRPE